MGRCGLLCALAACAVLMPVLTGAAAPVQSSQPSGDAVTVEAVGLAAMPADVPLADVRRKALLDARRNAVIQACASVEVQDRVEGMRLQEGLVRAQALGYVQRVKVLEEGAVPDAKPPLYRVRVRAVVEPTGDRQSTALGQVRRDPFRPVVALSLKGGAPGLDMEQARANLLRAVRRCGVSVRQGDAVPALGLDMSVAPGSKRGGGSLVVDWELSAGSDESSPLPAGHYVGHWEVVKGGARQGAWERIGTLIAQDAVRLWATPRWTTVRFQHPSRAQADALARSFGRSAEAKVTTADGLSALSVGLPVAGDPLNVVNAFVRRAGLSEQVELTSASLTELTFARRAAPAAEPTRQTPQP